MKKNKFIKIILSFIIGFNFLIPILSHAENPDENQPDQQKIYLSIYYKKKLHTVWIKKEAVISALDTIFNTPLNYLYNDGTVLNKSSVAKDVLVEKAFLAAVDINDKTNCLQRFQNILTENINTNNNIRFQRLLLSEDPDLEKQVSRIKDLHFLKEINSSKKWTYKMCKTLRNYTNSASTKPNPKILTVIDNEQKPSEPSNDPLPPFWD